MCRIAFVECHPLRVPGAPCGCIACRMQVKRRRAFEDIRNAQLAPRSTSRPGWQSLSSLACGTECGAGGGRLPSRAARPPTLHTAAARGLRCSSCCRHCCRCCRCRRVLPLQHCCPPAPLHTAFQAPPAAGRWSDRRLAWAGHRRSGSLQAGMRGDAQGLGWTEEDPLTRAGRASPCRPGLFASVHLGCREHAQNRSLHMQCTHGTPHSLGGIPDPPEGQAMTST